MVFQTIGIILSYGVRVHALMSLSLPGVYVQHVSKRSGQKHLMPTGMHLSTPVYLYNLHLVINLLSRSLAISVRRKEHRKQIDTYRAYVE
jgi:predicted transporter